MKRFLASVLLLLLLALAAPAPSKATGAGLLTAPTFTRFAAPPLPGADAAREPTLGFGPQAGRVLYQSGSATFRVALSPATGPTTATWTASTGVAAPLGETIVYTDAVTGRTWRATLVGACTTHASSDDGGATWDAGGVACVGTERPSLSAGPAMRVGAGFPRALYSCAQDPAVQCARSDDGGVTFGPPSPVACGAGASGAGDVHAAEDGAVYVPFLSCGGTVGVARSLDGGLTWGARPIGQAFPPATGFAPDVATTSPGGHLYVAYPTAANRAGVARSEDQGITWTVFGDVGAPAGVVGSAFHQAVAGDDGRAAVAFLGTTDAGNPFVSSFNGLWRLYVGVTFDGATWTTGAAGTDIVQRGWICAAGVSCSSGRNLFESMDAALDARGVIHVALADGCINACEGPTGTKAQSTSSWATLVVQTGGTDLIAP